MLKVLMKELLWIPVSLVATILIAYFLFNWSLGNSTIDIYLHDTVFVIGAPWMLLLPLFFFLTFLIFFTKELPKKFSRKIPNTILIASVVCFFIVLTSLLIAINWDVTTP